MSLVAYDDSSNDSDCSNLVEEKSDNFNDIKPGKDTADITKEKLDSNGIANENNRLDATSSSSPANKSQHIAIVKNAHTINDKEIISEQNAGRKTTKIYISKLASFNDIRDTPRPNKVRQTGSSLLQMLPKPKTEVPNNVSQQPCSTILASNNTGTVPIAFIPDVIKYKRPTYNTENVDQICDKYPLKKLKLSNKNTAETMKPNNCPNTDSTNSNCDTNLMNLDSNADITKKIKHNSNTDDDDDDDVENDNRPENVDGKNDGNGNGNDNDSDNECTDYFALNAKDELPEVNQSELETTISPTLPAPKLGNFHANPQPASLPPQLLDKNAMTALHGSAAKRQQNRFENIKFIDISSNEVHPDRTEWMRNAMKSSTKYEPTGVLLDEEPAAGTRRKHQITYLAHKAKANEAELQAMWSTNRHTRRVTQNKYGF